MTLGELADASEVPARTIRFYIARGLLDGPLKAGRGAAYTPGHVARLEKIKRLQAKGRMLSEIGHILGGKESQPVVAPPTAWWQHAISDDIVVLMRADMAPWRIKQARAAIDEVARRLQQPVNERTKE